MESCNCTAQRTDGTCCQERGRVLDYGVQPKIYISGSKLRTWECPSCHMIYTEYITSCDCKIVNVTGPIITRIETNEEYETTIATREWWETTATKSGWLSTDWSNVDGLIIYDDDFELIEIIDVDKHGHVIKAKFRRIDK